MGAGASIRAPEYCCAAVPPAQRYHPVTNPTGARCDVYDHAVNVYGRDPETGFARRPLDNVGIQYGLKALNAGSSASGPVPRPERADRRLRQRRNSSPQRTVADLAAIRAAYRTGRLTNGGGGLATIPIIDYRDYNDERRTATSTCATTRSRCASADQGQRPADNHVMLVEDNRYGLYSNDEPALQDAISQMDRWLTAIEADTRDDPADRQGGARKAGGPGGSLLDARPDTRRSSPRRRCASSVEPVRAALSVGLVPARGGRRRIATDIIKCQLKPIAAATTR